MIEHARSLNQALLTAMDSYADHTCFHVRRGKRFRAISYQRFQGLTFRLVNFFCQQGISKGERVAIIADNPLEWMAVYVACFLSGSVAVPLHAWLPFEILQIMVKDSGACLAVVQGEGQRQLIQEAGQGLPDLKFVLVVNELEESLAGVLPIAAVLAKSIMPEEEETLRIHAESIEPQALAAIYYKTGRPPKGVVFDHGQRLAAMQHMAEWFTLDEDDVAITTILSWSLSSLDAALHYFLSGIPHVVTESSESLPESLQQLTPTVGLTTPSGPESFYNQTIAEIETLPAARQALFQWALKIGQEYRAAGLAASKELLEAYARADRVFFSQIRSRVGGTSLRRLYSTGAPLPQQWVEFLEIITRTQVFNSYSLTEAGGFPAVSQPDAHRPDSCGQVAPGFQIRIADDGEVLVRGQAIMRQYWQLPQETQQALDHEGWLHTGDLGRFDQDGFLYLTDHKQPLILLSTGRDVMPTTLEKALTDSPFIHQAVIFGQGRPYVSALITADLPAIAGHLQKSEAEIGNSPLTSSQPRVKDLVDQAVEEVNSRLDHWRHIQRYTLLDRPFCEEEGELTPSHKPCREIVAERYATQIEAMYPQTVQLDQREVSQQVQLDLAELHELLEKQDILDAWMQDAGIGFLFDLAREKLIDAPSMVHIADTVAAIAQMQSEEKPMSTALIVGDPLQIANHLPESEIQLQRYDHIRRMRQILVTLVKMVDGIVLGYVVDKNGIVRGIYKLGDGRPHESADFLLGPQFRHHAMLSQGCEAIVFFVPAGGRQVRVFSDGQLVGRYANGSWFKENIAQIDGVVAQLAERKKYKPNLLQRVLRCAFQMSERNLGAIFVVGDADLILEHSDPPEISPFATIADTALDRLSDRELINFAKQDGATILDAQGTFRGCMVLLRPGANTQAEIGPGKGARHSSAAKMSAEAQCLAITVSQDGPITIYDSGQRVLSL